MVKKIVVATIVGIAGIGLIGWSFIVNATVDMRLHITSTIEQKDCMLCSANSDEINVFPQMN